MKPLYTHGGHAIMTAKRWTEQVTQAAKRFASMLTAKRWTSSETEQGKSKGRGLLHLLSAADSH